MRINAYEKFIKTIDRNIGGSIKSSRMIKDETELADMLKNLESCGYSLIRVKQFYDLDNTFASEIVYDSGLIILKSSIAYRYKDNDNKKNIVNQITVFSSYDEEPLVNIVKTEKEMSWAQLLVKSNPKDDIFAYKDRDIVSEDVGINLKGNKCGSHFVTYRRLKDNSLVIEKYRQHYPISKYNDRSNDLIRLCGFGNRDLEIIYREDEPVYAELSDKYNVAMDGFDCNDPIDVKCIVNKINKEVDAICGVIATDLTEFQKNKDEKKRVKTP